MDTLRQWLEWLWQENPEEIVGGILFLILSALVTIFKGTLKHVWAAIRRKLSPPPPTPAKESTLPLKEVSLPELFKNCIRGCDQDNPLNANYPYTPRDKTTKDELDKLFHTERRLLIVGKSGVGKTREALELLKRQSRYIDAILELKHLAVPYRYMPPGDEVILFINDLPNFFPQGASTEAVQKMQATLEEICNYLKGKTRRLFVLATARTDMGQLERTGYKPNGFWRFFYLPELRQKEAVGKFVDAVARKQAKQGMTLSGDARQTLIRLGDGTYQGIIEYLEDKKAKSINHLEKADDYRGYVHYWKSQYKDLVERDEAIRYAFEALAVLYQVRAEPYEFLVAGLGGRLMPAKWRDIRTWIPWGRRRRAERAIENLVNWRHIERFDGLLLCHSAKLDEKGDWRKRVEIMAGLFLEMAVGRRAELLSPSLFSLGVASQIGKFTTPAVRLYARLLEINPNYTEAHLNYGVLLKELGRKGAEDHWKRALEINPNYTEAHVNYGLFLEELGRKGKAEDHYKRALEINPNYTEAHLNYGVFLKELGRKPEAEDHYKRALEINPNDAKAHSNYGVLLGELGRKPEAEDHYKRALKINPNLAKAHFNYGLLLGELGRKPEAEDHYKRALKINPNYAEAHFNYGVLLEELGREDEMREQMALACACALDSPTITLKEILEHMVRFTVRLAREGKREKALRLCNYLIEFWRREGLEKRAPELVRVMRAVRKALK